MTTEEAVALGYTVVMASLCEVGLVKGGGGVRTWWCSDFDHKLPGLDHPRILEFIERHEKYLNSAH